MYLLIGTDCTESFNDLRDGVFRAIKNSSELFHEAEIEKPIEKIRVFRIYARITSKKDSFIQIVFSEGIDLPDSSLRFLINDIYAEAGMFDVWFGKEIPD